MCKQILSYDYKIAKTIFRINNPVNEDFSKFRYEVYSDIKTKLINLNHNQIDIRNINEDCIEEEFINHDDYIEFIYLDTFNNLVLSRLIIYNTLCDSLLECFIMDDEFNQSLIRYNLYVYFKIALLHTPGINLHAAAIDWHGKGILFSAPSETGKSTQARLWVEYENAEIINGDRPAITVIDGLAEVHGTPWSGSDPIIRNVSAPITCIVVLEQAKYNEIKKLTKEDALSHLLPRFFIPSYNELLTNKALDVIEEIINRVPIYKLKCLPDKGAIEVLKKELSLLEE